jgi:RNA polymerase sigma factor (TIGR02999 family)
LRVADCPVLSVMDLARTIERPGDISQLLVRWSAGDQAALDELMPMVYAELRRLSRSAIRRERGESMLQPTALVHEAWLRMADDRRISMGNRRQFYALASKMMRGILVDHLRKRQAAKRGGSQIEIPLEKVNAAQQPRCVDFLALDQAMTRLGEIRPRYQEIVEMRFLGGLTVEETADVLSVSHATIEREWNFARLWLRRELELGSPGAQAFSPARNVR